MNAAFIAVDVQEDFLPPNGALAVTDGRDVIPLINKLLSLPWTVKIGSKDWHPNDHVSFAANHNKQPFETIQVESPEGNGVLMPHTVWPVHCVQGTQGAEYGDGLENDKIDVLVKKGYLSDREYYSAFRDVWGLHKTELYDILKQRGITKVYCAGLATDFCVFHTALDAAKYGFETYVIQDATKPVYPGQIDETIEKLQHGGVKVISSDSEEILKIAAGAGAADI